MAFEETREQQNMYNMFRSCIYILLIIELAVHIPLVSDEGFFRFIFNIIGKFKLFTSLPLCKLGEIVCIVVVATGTTAKKAVNFSMKKMVVIPAGIGLTCIGICILACPGAWGPEVIGMPLNKLLYVVTSIVGTMFTQQGLDALAKYFNSEFGKDRFNYENESFQQSEKKAENEYSINIPMVYYWKKRMHKGWINIINPFRGTIVLGTPGSGKSFGIIDPFIRQHSAKGFAMMVYDYKFPTLAKTLFYQYCKNKKLGKLPEGCKFRVVNFTDVEYSHRINPVQKKYIPDLAAASETAATLLASLNKGGGEKKGGSDAFFTNSAENYLAAIIYFFVNFRPSGFLKGKPLEQYVMYQGRRLLLKHTGENGLKAVDEGGRTVLDFMNIQQDGSVSNAAVVDGLPVDLNGLKYIGMDYSSSASDEKTIVIERTWYEDAAGNEVKPDTITGRYSDMPHVLAFLGRKYDETFNILMEDEKIASLMAPFKSAFDAKANDQLEGMVGTLRVNSARLVSPEAYWIFSGDDFDLKISDRNDPCYLVIANDPEKEQVIGTLNALVLNRLVTRVNSKGNLPCSIIVDELPTLYFHKIDRLIGTARSNKVSVTLGFQELPQLEDDYGKTGMQKIITTCGNVFMGAARAKETLEWASNDIFGKVKQQSTSIAINDNKISTTLSEKMDNLVPAAKIADMATGWLAGQAARDFTATDSSFLREFDIENSEEFKPTKYFCKTHFDMKAIKEEEGKYVDIPKIYRFKDQMDRDRALNRNFKRINKEIDDIIHELLGEE